MGFWITFFIYAALAVLTELLAPKPKLENAKPAGIGDFQFPTATEGRAVPLMWGTARIAGPNVIWYGDLVQDPIREEVSTGLFSSKDVTVGFRYFLGMQQLLCQGEVTALKKIWIGDRKVVDGTFVHGDTFTIDEPDLFGGDDLGAGGFEGTFKFFAGTNSQAKSDYLAQFQKEPPTTGDTPAYRDYCYFANDTERAYFGNSTRIDPWKIELQRTPNPLALTAGRHIVNDGDANPANVIYEAFVNTEYGFGIPAADINTAQWQAVGNQLYDEGNGFSMVLDNQEEIGEMIRRLEQQIDAITYLNPFTGKWEIKLVRDDYDPLTIDEIDDDNIIEINNPTYGTWEGTKNQVRVPFVQRDDEYKSTYGFAQDMANMQIVGKQTNSVVRHPGIQQKDLANSVAWRELRTLATPLISGDWVVNRSMYGKLPGDVVAWTTEDLNFTRLPMRIRAVNYGELLDGRITLSLVRDVFRAAVGSFNAPPGGGWEPPSEELVPFPADEQLAFEAPRALTLRDPHSPSPYTNKVYAAARRQGPETAFKMVERHSGGTPTGAFTEFGQVYGFTKIGELLSSLPVGSLYPLSTLTVVPTPDSQSDVESQFPDITDLSALGTDLLTLCMIGPVGSEEFFLVSSAQTSGGNVQLNNVYRGVCDTPQVAHSAGDPVFLLFVGGGISTGTIQSAQNVHVKLLPRSLSGTLDESLATQIAFTMANRTRRPYAPAEMTLNGVRFDPTVSLEGGAGVGEAIGIDLDFIRRDFRTTDEIESLLTDAETLDPSYPAANTTTHEVEVINDPAGTPVTLFTQSLAALASGSITRLDILQATGGEVPTTLRFALRSTHVFNAITYDSRYDLVWDFALSSALTGLFEFGALDTNVASAAFTVDAGGNDHDFTLSSAFAAGSVEYRINGGAWTSLITAGNTTGTIPNASINNGDTIEIRHTSSDVGAQKLIEMDDGVAAAFAVLYV
jgi:hypothetical protein